MPTPGETLIHHSVSAWSAHLHGYGLSRGVWTNKPGDTLIIPNIKLTEYEEFSVGWKNKGESIDGILKNRGVTCNSYGVDCGNAVKILNASNPQALEVSYEVEWYCQHEGCQQI